MHSRDDASWWPLGGQRNLHLRPAISRWLCVVCGSFCLIVNFVFLSTLISIVPPFTEREKERNSWSLEWISNRGNERSFVNFSFYSVNPTFHRMEWKNSMGPATRMNSSSSRWSTKEWIIWNPPQRRRKVTKTTVRRGVWDLKRGDGNLEELSVSWILLLRYSRR